MFAAFMLGLILGVWAGWNQAHHVVADECERLSGFFVGKRVFRCHEVKDASD